MITSRSFVIESGFTMTSERAPLCIVSTTHRPRQGSRRKLLTLSIIRRSSTSVNRDHPCVLQHESKCPAPTPTTETTLSCVSPSMRVLMPIKSVLLARDEKGTAFPPSAMGFREERRPESRLLTMRVRETALQTLIKSDHRFLIQQGRFHSNRSVRARAFLFTGVSSGGAHRT